MSENKLLPHFLTDDQCDEFRRLPLKFNDMIRAIYFAGYSLAIDDMLHLNIIDESTETRL
jgi:hypothetical protein